VTAESLTVVVASGGDITVALAPAVPPDLRVAESEDLIVDAVPTASFAVAVDLEP
jgi:hypothetical protein